MMLMVRGGREKTQLREGWAFLYSRASGLGEARWADPIKVQGQIWGLIRTHVVIHING
ncbi:hypothetical protein HanPSC8_Chr15g0652101 [Helianthus annuus]|nr:hypothetical protein HanPSC8_Chr15g0652101 [Helianthus annuus]